MKRYIQKITPLLLILALLLSMVGCGAETTTESEETSSEVSTETTTEETTVEEEQTTTEETEPTKEIKYKDSLKVLAIGNSFSVDGMEYLWNICDDQGIETIVLGNLYIGGCTLDTHWNNISNKTNAYTYYKNTTGKWVSTASVSVQTAIADEEWDVITIQQASGSSGRPTTYGNLTKILEWIDTNKTNENAEIIWHMTWAYAQNSTHKEFVNYQKNQMTMYQNITETVQSTVTTNTLVQGVIPSGTALQNLRSSYVGDTITRDGYHLHKGIGRYTASLTWFAAITGRSVESVKWVPINYSALKNNLPAIKEAVTNSIQTPYSVTQSSYTEAPN